MPQQRTNRSKLVADFEPLLQDKDAWDEFKRLWRQIEASRRADLEQIVQALRHAWFEKEIDRICKEQLNRKDLDDLRQRLLNRMGDLGQEILDLVNGFPRFANLAAWRGPVNVSGNTITFGRPREEFPVHVRPIVEAYTKLDGAIRSVFEELDTRLKRKKGHQPKPWIARAMLSLQDAGVSQIRADALLRVMRLKGREAAEASRQTLPL